MRAFRSPFSRSRNPLTAPSLKQVGWTRGCDLWPFLLTDVPFHDILYRNGMELLNCTLRAPVVFNYGKLSEDANDGYIRYISGEDSLAPSVQRIACHTGGLFLFVRGALLLTGQHSRR